MRDFEELTPEGKSLFVHEFQNVKRIVQTKKRRLHALARVSTRRAFELAYRCTMNVPVFDRDLVATSSWGDADPLDDLDDLHRVKIEFARAVLSPKKYYSFGPYDELDVKFTLFQVVWVNSPGSKWVRSSGPPPTSWIQAGVVYWHPHQRLPPSACPVLFDAFHEPGVGTNIVDFMRLCPWMAFKHTFRTWDVETSDFFGCVQLTNERLLINSFRH